MPSFDLRTKVLGRAAFFAAAIVFAVHAPAGCTTNEVKDASDAKPVFECSSEPVLFCQPLPPGSQGCTGAKDSPDTYLQRLPADKAFAENCVANFVRKDVNVEDVCGLSAVCTCVRVTDTDAAVPPPPRDAGADTSTAPDTSVADADVDAEAADAEADTSVADAAVEDSATPTDAAPTPGDAAPPPPATGRLVWSCR